MDERKQTRHKYHDGTIAPYIDSSLVPVEVKNRAEQYMSKQMKNYLNNLKPGEQLQLVVRHDTYLPDKILNNPNIKVHKLSQSLLDEAATAVKNDADISFWELGKIG